MITMGGNAEIELIDSMDPFSEGEILRQRGWLMLTNDRCCALDHASEEELESHCQSLRRREGQPFRSH